MSESLEAGQEEVSNMDDRIANLEKRIEEISSELEDTGKHIFRQAEEGLWSRTRKLLRRDHDSLFWGVILICGGVVWLGKSVGFINIDIPLLPTLLIAIGLFMIFSSRR